MTVFNSRSPPASGSEIDQLWQASGIESLGPSVSESRTISLFIFVALISFFLLILLALHSGQYLLADPDVFWHIATGQKIWETASFPRMDEFSHTFQGHPWTTENWLAELVLFGAYSLAGWRGVALLAACAIAVSYALLFLVLSNRIRLTVSIGVAAAAYAFSLAHFSARPQIFVDSLVILWAAGLVSAVDRKTSPSLLLLPIMTLWANLHASFAFGLALSAALAGEAFLSSADGERIRTAKRWAVFLGLAGAAACATPYGYEPILHAIGIFRGNEALPYIQEWRPTTIRLLSINGPALAGLLFLAMHQGIRVPTWRLLIVIGLIYLMMCHARFGSLFAILTPILLAAPLARQFPFLRLSNQLQQDPSFFRVMGRVARRGLHPACAVVLCAVIANGAWGGTVLPQADIAPAEAVDYIDREHLTGNIYNPYDFGGYLIFRHVKTFIDGRTEQLFLGGFIRQLFDIVEKHPRKFMALLEQYNVSLALVIPDSIESQELAASDHWEKVYADNVAEVYRKLR
jgi:hypothetical protein